MSYTKTIVAASGAAGHGDAELRPILDESAARGDWLPYGTFIRVGGTIAVALGHIADMVMFHDGSVKTTLLADATIYAPSGAWWVANFYDAISRFAVPLFIMLSGAILLNPHRQSMKKFYQRRLSRLGVAVVFWSVFFMWFSVQVTGWATAGGITPGEKPVTTNIWWELLEGKPYVHLHFVFRLAVLYALTPVLWVFTAHATRRTLTLTVVLLLGLAAGDSVVNAVIGTELSAFARFAPFLGYYLAGYLLRECYVGRRGYVLAWAGLLASTGILFAGTGWLVSCYGMAGYPSVVFMLYDFLSPVRVGMSLCAWVVVVNTFKTPWVKLGWPGRLAENVLAPATLGVYLCHPLFRELLSAPDKLSVCGFQPVNWMIHAVGAERSAPVFTWPNAWVGIPLFTLVILVPSVLLTLVLMRIPLLRRVVG